MRLKPAVSLRITNAAASHTQIAPAPPETHTRHEIMLRIILQRLIGVRPDLLQSLAEALQPLWAVLLSAPRMRRVAFPHLTGQVFTGRHPLLTDSHAPFKPLPDCEIRILPQAQRIQLPLYEPAESSACEHTNIRNAISTFSSL